MVWKEKKKFEVKKSTYCNYANLLKNNIIPVLGEVKFNELNGDILQFFIYKVQGENNLSQKTIILIAAHYHEYGKPDTWYAKTICWSYFKMVVNVLLSIIGKIVIIVAIRRRKSVPEELLLTKKDLCKAVQQHL